MRLQYGYRDVEKQTRSFVDCLPDEIDRICVEAALPRPAVELLHRREAEWVEFMDLRAEFGPRPAGACANRGHFSFRLRWAGLCDLTVFGLFSIVISARVLRLAQALKTAFTETRQRHAVLIVGERFTPELAAQGGADMLAANDIEWLVISREATRPVVDLSALKKALTTFVNEQQGDQG